MVVSTVDRLRQAPRRGRRAQLAMVAGGLSVALVFAPSILASGATVTRGEIGAFAAGAGLSISGHAQMVRTPDGKTIVTIHVEGLAPGVTYA